MSLIRSLLITSTALGISLTNTFASTDQDPLRVTFQGGSYERSPIDTQGINDKSAIALAQMTLSEMHPWLASNARSLTALSLVNTKTSLSAFRKSFGQSCPLETLNLRGLSNLDGTPVELIVFLQEHASDDLLKRLESGSCTLKFTAPDNIQDAFKSSDASGARRNESAGASVYKDDYIQRLSTEALTLRAYQTKQRALFTPLDERSDEEKAWDRIVNHRRDTQEIYDIIGAPIIHGDASKILAARFKNAHIPLGSAFLTGAKDLKALVFDESTATLSTSDQFGKDWTSLELLVLGLSGLDNPMNLFAAAHNTVLQRIADKSLIVYMNPTALQTSPQFNAEVDSSAMIRQMARAVLAQRGVTVPTGPASPHTSSSSLEASAAQTSAQQSKGRWFPWFTGSTTTESQQKLPQDPKDLDHKTAAKTDETGTQQ